jgi:acetyl esterase
MPIDPQARAILDGAAALNAPSVEEVGVEEARRSLAALVAMQSPSPDLGGVEDRQIPGPAGKIPVRVYTPLGAGPFPVLVYFHGGGFVLCNVDTHDGTCRSIAAGSGCVVVSVDYRLAPEHRFPAAAEDCYAATRWVAGNAGLIGGDATRIGVGGDSAGGNLAAVTALMCRDRGGPRLGFQLLVYPVIDAACDTPSFRENAEGYYLTASAMRWFWAHYLAEPHDGAHPYATPLRAPDLSGLPPALIITAEYDPLRDEGETYAKRLGAAGVPVTLSRYDGMIHGFFSMGMMLDRGREAMAEAAAALRSALAA